MQENHLKPNEEGFQDNPQELLNASLLFARALGLILKENEGIVVDVVGDINLGEEVKKVIVFKFENQVHIYKCEEDIPEGNAVNMDTSSVKESEE
jgi:hypothetical protein